MRAHQRKDHMGIEQDHRETAPDGLWRFQVSHHGSAPN
jgi:hypothetical protein